MGDTVEAADTTGFSRGSDRLFAITFNSVSGGAGQLLVSYYRRFFGSGFRRSRTPVRKLFQKTSFRLQKCRILDLWKKHNMDVDFLFRRRLGDSL